MHFFFLNHTKLHYISCFPRPQDSYSPLLFGVYSPSSAPFGTSLYSRRVECSCLSELFAFAPSARTFALCSLFMLTENQLKTWGIEGILPFKSCTKISEINPSKHVNSQKCPEIAASCFLYLCQLVRNIHLKYIINRNLQARCSRRFVLFGPFRVLIKCEFVCLEFSLSSWLHLPLPAAISVISDTLLILEFMIST